MLEKAMTLVAKKNSMDLGMSLATAGTSTSFLSFSDSRISSKLSNLGISMGRDDKLIKSSIVSIQNIEIDRLVVSGKKRLENKNKLINLVDDDEERLDAILGHVCGNSNEDMQDQAYDHILSDLSPFPRKKMSNLTKMNKISRPPKKPKNPSKLYLQ